LRALITHIENRRMKEKGFKEKGLLATEDVFHDSTDASLDSRVVQSRLTVTGFALTVLIFSGSFTTALHGTFTNGNIEYRTEFLHVETSLALGIIASVLAIGCFLMSLQASSLGASWYSWCFSRQWWFSVGQILLYLALSQALTSSLTEVVYGIGLGTTGLLGIESVAWWIGLAALPVWWFVLFLGPINFIWRIGKGSTTEFGSSGLIALIGVYLLAILGILVANAEAYAIRGSGAPLHIGQLPVAILYQIFQPVTWYLPWDVNSSILYLGLAALIIGLVIGVLAMITFLIGRLRERGRTPAQATSEPDDGVEAAPPVREVESPKPLGEKPSPGKVPPTS
jgi:hypothetical protein